MLLATPARQRPWQARLRLLPVSLKAAASCHLLHTASASIFDFHACRDKPPHDFGANTKEVCCYRSRKTAPAATGAPADVAAIDIDAAFRCRMAAR